MTVRELINALKYLDQETDIWVNRPYGWEGDDCTEEPNIQLITDTMEPYYEPAKEGDYLL